MGSGCVQGNVCIHIYTYMYIYIYMCIHINIYASGGQLLVVLPDIQSRCRIEDLQIFWLLVLIIQKFRGTNWFTLLFLKTACSRMVFVQCRSGRQYVHIYTHTHIYIYIYIHVYIYIYIYIHVICIYIHIYIYMWQHVYTHTHTYIHT